MVSFSNQLQSERKSAGQQFDSLECQVLRARAECGGQRPRQVGKLTSKSECRGCFGSETRNSGPDAATSSIPDPQRDLEPGGKDAPKAQVAVEERRAEPGGRGDPAVNRSGAEGVLQMKQRQRINYSAGQQALIWERWRKGFPQYLVSSTLAVRGT